MKSADFRIFLSLRSYLIRKKILSLLLALSSLPHLNPSLKDFTISSDGDQDHEIVFDIPKGTESATYTDTYVIFADSDCTVTTMAIYAIFPYED